MLKKINLEKKILRVLDANTNRLKEALRVIEDIMRFVVDDKILTRKFKNIRHEITELSIASKILKSKNIIPERDILSDVGKSTTVTELKRKTIIDIFLANSQRAKESLRVLEEFLKLSDKNSSGNFKQLRYQLYALEKRAIKKLERLIH